MSLTPSTMLDLGTKAPDFSLIDVISEQFISLTPGIPVLIIFMCNHCPYVQHILPKLITLIKYYQNNYNQNNINLINFIAINSNNIKKYPEDSPEKMKELAQSKNFSFPYLFDETQETARKYHAACTPDFYLFDQDLCCVYRGRFDDSTPSNNKPVTGQDLNQAILNLLTHQAINPNQAPSIGCNIKWL